MNRQVQRNFRWVFWLLAVLGLTLDLTAKYVIFASLFTNAGWHPYEGKEYAFGNSELIEGKFRLDTKYEKCPTDDSVFHPIYTVNGQAVPAKNEGALFGVGQGYNSFFLIVSLAAAIGIIFWSTRPNAGRSFVLNLALGLILAGTLGNLYDRLIFGGVRDFLHWYYLVDWPVFNLADCCLVLGATILLVQAFFYQPAAKKVDLPLADGEAIDSMAVPAVAEPQPEVAEVK
jgi:lipoprotein signal peptidase